MANINQPNLTPEALLALLQANPAMLASLKAALTPQVPATPEPAPKRINEMDALTIAAFSKRGFSDIQPRLNILTKWKWMQAGFKVKEGEKAVRVRSLNLYHSSQVVAASSEEQAQYFRDVEERKSARQAKPAPAKLPIVSPIQAPIAVMPVQPQPDPAVIAEIEKLRRENEALKSAKAAPKPVPQKPSNHAPKPALPPVKKPAPKSEPEIIKAKSKASTKPVGRNKPNGTGPQPHV